MMLVSDNINLFNNSAWTLQIDRQTDRRTDKITANTVLYTIAHRMVKNKPTITLNCELTCKLNLPI